LVLCAKGTVAGTVETAGSVPYQNELVEAFQNGVKVGEDYTDLNGNYMINDIATDCFGAVTTCATQTGCDSFYVKVAGWQRGPFKWTGCGEHQTVNFTFP